VAADGAEALDVARNHCGEISLLLTDVVMPQMGGPQLAVRLRGASAGPQGTLHVRLYGASHGKRSRAGRRLDPEAVLAHRACCARSGGPR